MFVNLLITVNLYFCNHSIEVLLFEPSNRQFAGTGAVIILHATSAFCLRAREGYAPSITSWSCMGPRSDYHRLWFRDVFGVKVHTWIQGPAVAALLHSHPIQVTPIRHNFEVGKFPSDRFILQNVVSLVTKTTVNDDCAYTELAVSEFLVLLCFLLQRYIKVCWNGNVNALGCETFLLISVVP